MIVVSSFCPRVFPREPFFSLFGGGELMDGVIGGPSPPLSAQFFL